MQHTITENSKAQPIWRWLVWTMVIVAIFPAGLLSIHLYQSAWDNAWREINEKHRLLALNMASPIKTYIKDHRNMLGQMSETMSIYTGSPKQIQGLMERNFKYLEGFDTLAFLNLDGAVKALVHRGSPVKHNSRMVVSASIIEQVIKNRDWVISNMERSSITDMPILVMALPVFNTTNQLAGILLAELRIDLIEELRKNIHFGEKGHSAIVDRTGRVIAHPNPEWMLEIRDLSHLPIVKKMMAGETGVTEFYSPFIKADMVAGYTGVRDLGWGIMVPQPKSEVEEQVRQLMSSYLVWLTAGIIVALLAGVLLVRWIVTPINRLAVSAREVSESVFSRELTEIPATAPREIHVLRAAFAALIAGFRLAQMEIRDMSLSLNEQDAISLEKMKQVRSRVNSQSTSDYLSGLPGGDYLCTELANRLTADTARPLCLAIISIDSQDAIARDYGHGMASEVIRSVSRMLENSRDYNDVLARYDDSFALLMECSQEEAIQRAARIIKKIQSTTFQYIDKQCNVTLSISLGSDFANTQIAIEEIITHIYTTMMEAKQQGGNRLLLA